MFQLPTRRDVVHGCFFVLVAGCKTLVTVGQGALTVDTTVRSLNCLESSNHENANYSHFVHHLSIALQVVAIVFSVSIITLTRYPAIWQKLTIHGLYSKFRDLDEAFHSSSKKQKAALIFIALFGIGSCFARGLSGYLSVEVVGDRLKANAVAIAVCAWVTAISVCVSSMCFNLSNLLSSAIKYIKEPGVSFRPSVMISMIATISNAVAMRFFVMKFLERRHASFVGQIVGQSIFTMAEFVLGLFTMVSSFEHGWKQRAKEALTNGKLLAFLMGGDALTTWLGYSMITWYSILTNLFFGMKNAVDNPPKICKSQPGDPDFIIGWCFMGLACFIGAITTFAYCHYLLEHADRNYQQAVEQVKAWRCRFFKRDEAALLELTASTHYTFDSNVATI